MSWLNAHDSYVMEIIARDRVDELRSTIDVATAHTKRVTALAGAIPDAQHTTTEVVVLCPRALAKASR